MLSGIVLTGGAARIPDLPQAFARQTAGELNIRIAKGLPENVTISFGVQVGEPDRLYTLYALLLEGTENCVGEESKVPAQDTFDFEQKKEEEPETKVEQEGAESSDILEKPEKKGPSAFSRLWKTIGDMLSDEADRDDNA